jgi:predicted nucleotidyltransferase
MKPSIALGQHKEEVRKVLERFHVKNPKVFGSVARGEDTEKSDIDILIEVDKDISYYELAQIETELEAILGCRVDVVTRACLAPDVAERAEADLLPIS